MSIFVSSKYRQVITYSIMKQENIPWELIISKFKQEISEKDDARLMSWAERPECRSVMEDLNVVWKRVQEKTSDYTPDKEYYWKVLSARIGKAGKPQVEVLQEKASGKTFTLRSLYRYIAAACVVRRHELLLGCLYGQAADGRAGIYQHGRQVENISAGWHWSMAPG